MAMRADSMRAFFSLRLPPLRSFDFFRLDPDSFLAGATPA